MGTLPTGFLLAKAKGIDIRTVGSGNIGATNVIRTVGTWPGILALLIDFSKGFLACKYLPLLFGDSECSCLITNTPWPSIAAGLAAILGHNYSCWLQFKGGKGIATSAGVFLALSPIALAIILGIWIAVFAMSRFVSLASIIAAAALPIAVELTQPHQSLTLFAVALSALAIWRHKSNISRLLKGTEHSFRLKTPAAMNGSSKKITVLGAGAWGTALAKLLAENGHRVTLWGHDTNRLADITRTRQNNRLPGIELPATVRIESNLTLAAEGAECLIIAVPSQFLRAVTSQLPQFSGIAISVTKGIESDTGLTMGDILSQTMPQSQSAALSGPSFAIEVARGTPTAVVVASRQHSTASAVQSLFHSGTFRVYNSTDLRGVELGGALKNVMGIAAGVCDGLGLGDNSKAALLTRAIAEMRRLGVARGAQAETFSGLSGLGDLSLTCYSRLSRNRALGERLGRDGVVPNENDMPLAEGFPTAKSAHQLARSLGVETPIIDAVHAMLYEGKPPKEALQNLLTRQSKCED